MSHVLFITRKFRGRGGMQQHTRDLWRAFQELDAHARLIRPRTLVGYVLFPFLAVFRSVRAARRGCVIHVGDMALAPLAKVVKAFVPRAKVTATACGLDVIYPRRWYQWMLRRSLPSIDRFLCISHATADAVRMRGGKQDRIDVVPCGVWMDVALSRGQRKWRNGPHLLTIGRLIPRKGVAWFIAEVYPLLLAQYPDLHYTVVGAGPAEKLIKKIIQEKGLEEGLSLKGEVESCERDCLLLAADCLVVPNVPVEGDMEGFGIVCIEASSRGVPVVAARLEGLTDAVVEGETGLFFRPQDPLDCVRTINALLCREFDPLGVSRVTREHYGWEVLIPQYRDALFFHS